MALPQLPPPWTLLVVERKVATTRPRLPPPCCGTVVALQAGGNGPSPMALQADCIMFPEVPIALMLLGHLLLGVVQIYSKKVDYLHLDCNEVLSQMCRMFASVHVNLPEDADCVTFQAVIPPDTFGLDALEMDTVPCCIHVMPCWKQRFSEEAISQKTTLPQYDEPTEDEGITLDESGQFAGEAEKKLEEAG